MLYLLHVFEYERYLLFDSVDAICADSLIVLRLLSQVSLALLLLIVDESLEAFDLILLMIFVFFLLLKHRLDLLVDQDIWKHGSIEKVRWQEVGFTFINHLSPCLIVEADFLAFNLDERVGYHGDYQIHEDHEKRHLGKAEDDPSRSHNQNRVVIHPMLLRWSSS